MSVLLDNKESSLFEDLVRIFLYGYAYYLKDYSNLRKEAAKECESSSNNRSKKEGESIRGQLTTSSQYRNRKNNNYGQQYSPDKHPFCCPSCGAGLSLNLCFSKGEFSFAVASQCINNLGYKPLPIWRRYNVFKSRWLFRCSRFYRRLCWLVHIKPSLPQTTPKCHRI